ncbi:MAG: CoA pyrophosphatase [Rhodothermales bacterium]
MDDFAVSIDRIRARLAEPLPGPQAHLRMAPERPGVEDRHVVVGRKCREAAVLVLLLPVGARTHVLLTLRHGHLAHHAGQISFPGGGREEGEELLTTALREAEEEVGLDVSRVDVLGPLTPLFIPPSNYCVFPFLGASDEDPRLTPQDSEVDQILRVPLVKIAHESTLRQGHRIIRGEHVLVPFFDVDGMEIWGATAMVLSELVALFE